MKKVRNSLVVLFVTLGLVGCAPKESSQKTEDKSKETEEQAETGEIFFNGSSTLAPVISAIGLEFNEEFETWNNVNADFPEAPISIYVSAGGSGQGTKTLIEGTTNFGMIAREVKKEEATAIKDVQEYLVGIDALTLSVNPDNPLVGVKDSLTKEQIQAIFSGKYKTWQDLDKRLPAENIVVITRDIGGGAHEVFQKNIMGDVDVSSEAIQAPSMGGLVTKITDNQNAIGYASFGVATQQADNIVMLAVDDVEPSKATIQSGDYIIQRPLLILGAGQPTAMEQAFLDVVLGKQGQEIVEKMGFIPAK